MSARFAVGDRVVTPDGPGRVIELFTGSATGLPYVGVAMDNRGRNSARACRGSVGARAYRTDEIVKERS